MLNYITIAISIISLIISILNMINSRKNKEKERAPILEINQSYYNGSKYVIPEIVSQIDNEREEIILDRRLFLRKEDKKIESWYSLIIDTAVKEKEYLESIGFDTLVIRNVGYSLSKITIEEIAFSKSGCEKRVLNSTKRNKLLLNMRKNDEISVLVSGRFGKSGYQPLITEKLNDFDGEYAKKLSEIKGNNLLNTRCISEADNWDRITIKVRTENLYGDKYIQSIDFSIVNNTYYMITSKSQLDKSNVLSRMKHLLQSEP